MSVYRMYIVDEIENARTLDELIDVMRDNYKINIKEDTVAGHRVAMFTRPKRPDDSNLMHDECTLIIVDEDLNVVARAFDRIYPFGDSYSGITTSDDSFPIAAEEWLPGILVVVSKFKDTCLISTENSITGSNIVFPGKKTVAEIVEEKLLSSEVVDNLDDLFDFGTDESVSWVFQLVPIRNNNYNLVLLGLIDLETLEELERDKTNILANNFGFATPEELMVITYNSIDQTMKTLYEKNKDMRGIILRDADNDRCSIKLHKHTRRARGYKGKILTIADCVLNGCPIDDENSLQIAKVMESNLKRISGELEVLYELNKNVRTKKKFVEKVSHYPVSRVLYAIKDGKIPGVERLADVVSPEYFVKIIDKIAPDEFTKAISAYKEMK